MVHIHDHMKASINENFRIVVGWSAGQRACVGVVCVNRALWTLFMYWAQSRKWQWKEYFIGLYKLDRAESSCSNPACIGLYLQSKLKQCLRLIWRDWGSVWFRMWLISATAPTAGSASSLSQGIEGNVSLTLDSFDWIYFKFVVLKFEVPYQPYVNHGT